MTITDVVGGGAVNASNASAGSQVMGVQFRSEGISYFERGSLKGSTTGTLTSQADGSVSVAGESKTTGGTGLFRGATGSGTLSGSVSIDLITTTFGKFTLSY